MRPAVDSAELWIIDAEVPEEVEKGLELVPCLVPILDGLHSCSDGGGPLPDQVAAVYTKKKRLRRI